MTTPIEHDLGQGRKAFEYSIPFNIQVIPDSIPRAQVEWLTRFSGKSSDAIQTILKSEWEHISSGAARIIADHLLSRSPRSILHNGDTLWMALHSDNHGTSTISLYPPMPAPAGLESVNSIFEIDDLESLQFHFWNLVEGATPHSSAFMVSRGAVSEKEFEGCGPWAGSLVVYYVLCGDCFLMNKEGKVGRWLHEFSYDPSDAGFSDGSCVEPLFESFDAFADAWLEYLEKPFNEKKDTPFW